jgi:hypothetical protein
VVRLGVELTAPQEGRQQTRVNWIAKQLRDDTVPDDLVVKVDWDRKNLFSQSKAGELREKIDGLLRDGHQQLVPDDSSPRRFILEWTRKLQKPKGRSTAAVLEGISNDLEDFYGRVVQKLVAYVAPAPKLPKEKQPDEVPSAAPPLVIPILKESALIGGGPTIDPGATAIASITVDVAASTDRTSEKSGSDS